MDLTAHDGSATMRRQAGARRARDECATSNSKPEQTLADSSAISEEEIQRVAAKLYRLLKRDDRDAFLGNLDLFDRTTIDGRFRIKRIAKSLITFIRQSP